VGDGDLSAPRSGSTGTAEAEPYSAGDAICPYQGLAPFEAEDAAMSFGRTRATRGRLDGHGSILMISGASGAGKSSLLRRWWNIASPADPAATACANAVRTLTLAEWQRYVPGEKYRRVCP
jgi:hypothetical protein